MNKKMQLLESLGVNDIKKHPFFKMLENKGKVFFVGGAVRDAMLGKVNKDIDILVTGIEFNTLAKILEPYGKVIVNSVGGKQAVIKLQLPGESEPIDIAIPRTEVKTGSGHQGFDINVDHNLPVEKDLERRDFTINAIAKDSNNKTVDPFGGTEDLKNKIIKVVNPKAFAEDPLRMLRAVQFASRFNFKIEQQTLSLIKKNVSSINEIAGERVLIELEKIVQKGNTVIGIKLLNQTGLFKAIFGNDFKGDLKLFPKCKTLADFIFALLLNSQSKISEIAKKRLKLNNKDLSYIDALQLCYENQTSDKVKNRMLGFQMFKISSESLNSNLLPDSFKKYAKEFTTGKMPKTMTDINITGDDLLRLGFRGQKIGIAQKEILQAIFSDKIKNNKATLMKFAINGLK